MCGLPAHRQGDRPSQKRHAGLTMRPFVYQRAGDVAAAVAAASQGKPGEPPTMAAAQYLAGGTTILDLMKLDVMRPEVLIDVATVDPVGTRIERRGDGLHLGA